MKLHKIVSYEIKEGPNAGQERVMLIASKEVEMLGGLASVKSFGKLYLPLGTTVEMVTEKFQEGAELPGVKFGEKYVNEETGEVENFHRIIPA